MSTNSQVRCENGDPFDLLLAQLDTLVIDWAENSVNWLIDRANDFFDRLPWPLDGIGRPLSRWCAPNPHQPQKCLNGGITDEQRQHFSDCENPILKGGLDQMCYYHRVRALSNSPDHTDHTD